MKLARWLLKIVLIVLLISGLAIMRKQLWTIAAFHSKHYLEGQSFGFGGMMKGLFGFHGGNGEDGRRDQEETAKTLDVQDEKTSSAIRDPVS